MNKIVEDLLLSLSAEQREEFEERAAIIEYDSGKPRTEAEALALLCILKNVLRKKENLI